MGPACIIKAVAGNRFSLVVFAFSQIAMDIQPLVHMLRGDGIVHGASHTLLGATVIGVLSAMLGRPVGQTLLRFWNPDPDDSPFLRWLHGTGRISWLSAAGSAFLGTCSHVFLDSVIHTDVHPLAPFTKENPLLGLVGFPGIHLLCAGTGLLGLIGLTVVYHAHATR